MRRQIVSLLLKLGPAFIERVEIFLRRFHFGMGSNEPGSVTCYRGVFERGPFVLKFLLGVSNALLNAGIFAGFKV